MARLPDAHTTPPLPTSPPTPTTALHPQSPSLSPSLAPAHADTALPSASMSLAPTPSQGKPPSADNWLHRPHSVSPSGRSGCPAGTSRTRPRPGDPSWGTGSGGGGEASIEMYMRFGRSTPRGGGSGAVVRSRNGSVLTRGLVLKTDQIASVTTSDLPLQLQGAPNFRNTDVGLEVYGVAQPSVTGVKTILSVLRCQPLDSDAARVSRTLSPTLHPQALSHPRLSRSRPGVASPPKIEELPPVSSSGSEGKTVAETASQADGSPSDGSPTSATPSPPPPPPPPHHTVWVCTREEPVVYISGRPFVLREASEPTRGLELSGRARNLEQIEDRLKADILREAERYGGLIMVHEENAEGDITPTWIAVDESSVQTVREVFEGMRAQRWRVEYHRIPVASDQPIEDNYLDAYVQVIRHVDPTRSSLVANCGVGVNRTTFAMVAALLVRRKQLLMLGRKDPFRIAPAAPWDNNGAVSGRSTPVPEARVVESLAKANAQQAHNLSLLRLIHVLERSLVTQNNQSAIQLLLSHPNLVEGLRSANQGEYSIVLSLTGLLDEGLECKRVVDFAIDSCSAVINLREAILESRVRYSTVASASDDPRAGSDLLEHAVKALERYIFLLAFASYVSGSQTAAFEHRFSDWLKGRAEIWGMIGRIRRKGRQLYFFNPVADLSLLSKGGSGGEFKVGTNVAKSKYGGFEAGGGSVPGDEFADFVVKNRSGVILRPSMLLKADIWHVEQPYRSDLAVRGTTNFRRIPGSSIYALGQPTIEGIQNVLETVKKENPNVEKITWLNLREEPLVYINGTPYCLRQAAWSLRNIKSYSGISASRLALLEDRLKNDVLAELRSGGNRLLLHNETADGSVVPVWDEAEPDKVATIQEAMSWVASQQEDIELVFHRVPITAEKPPDFSDFSDFLAIVLRANVEKAPVILNCQLGRGRSTLSAVIVTLITNWLRSHHPTYDKEAAEKPLAPQGETKELERRPEPLNYHVINSLLRVIRNGRDVKRAVDDAIDLCGSVTNIRDSIEEARHGAEEADSESVRKQRAQGGIHNLRRYFELIVFQAYLSQTQPDTLESVQTFEEFVRSQPVFDTIAKDLDNADMQAIVPLSKVEPGDGVALEDEVKEVVSNRSGTILSAHTMLKSDFFSGILKLGLPEKIEGAPNLRAVPLTLYDGTSTVPQSPPPTRVSRDRAGGIPAIDAAGNFVYGTGMPTVEGLRRALTRMGAGPDGQVSNVWTSLREEPVLYVNGRPHVLRFADRPFANMEATGIKTEAVESMEEALKVDVVREAASRNGRLLLHDEVEVKPGQYEIIPIWETVKEEDIMTPREVYALMQKEGFRVDYARVAITDEQAPIPAVFGQLESRVKTALRSGSGVTFNCQMGRGRTTTGMVVASLVASIAKSDDLYFSEMAKSRTFFDVYDPTTEDDFASREDDIYLQGEYKTILKLVGVLSHGKLAKKLTDKAIDRMQDVQNLRKAIFDFKLRLDSADPGTKKYRNLYSVTVNYLQRYAFLIVFTNWLLEKAHAVDAASSAASDADTEVDVEEDFPTFHQWLHDRSEITRVIERGKLD